MIFIPDQFYHPSVVAKYFEVTTHALRKWRRTRKYLHRHYKIGGLIRYKGCDLIEWELSNKK